MFRSLTSDGHVSGGQNSSSPTGHGVASSGSVTQENSWIGLLSVVSRPALSFLQKYLPGRTGHPVQADPAPRWLSGDSHRSFMEEETGFLKQLDAMMPPPHTAPHLTHLRCEHGGAAVPWLTDDALREMGIESREDMGVNSHQTQEGFVSSARTFLSQVLLSSVSEEVRPWVTVRGSESRTWWGSLWGEGVESQGLTSHVSWSEDRLLCPQQLGTETKNRSSVFVQRSGEERTLRENTGDSDHKQLPHNNGPYSVQNVDGSTPEQLLCISSSASNATCSEVTLLTPELDNGYSSLEEEHVLMSRLVTALSEEPQEAGPTDDCTAASTDMDKETCEGGASSSANPDGDQHKQDGQSTEVMAGSALQCQNKAIAFIMGCPCSDDDGSQSEDSDCSNDDDDGFDSEGSSDLSDDDSSDDDESSDSDEEAESEADRLWNSLCKSQDPYNLQNFTAVLHSGHTQLGTVHTAPHPIPTQSGPTSSPDITSPPPSSPAAPPPLTSSLDSWDDSTSASEVDEAESLRLWSSFSSSDPYSPLHFQAPVRTRGSSRAAVPHSRAKKTPHQNREAAPEQRKEAEEEQLNSGFSDPLRCSTTTSGATTKKVRFCDNVEEFFASCGEEEEDRRGPWEELARDRCRFLRRCQEVEQSIAYCLQPQHRLLVVSRLHVLYIQDQ